MTCIRCGNNNGKIEHDPIPVMLLSTLEKTKIRRIQKGKDLLSLCPECFKKLIRRYSESAGYDVLDEEDENEKDQLEGPTKK